MIRPRVSLTVAVAIVVAVAVCAVGAAQMPAEEQTPRRSGRAAPSAPMCR